MTKVIIHDIWFAKIYQLIWFILSLIEIVLVLRIVLKLLGANSFSGFVSFIYSISSPLIRPFDGMLRSSFGPNGSIMEWSSMLAAIVYVIIAWVILYFIQFLYPPYTGRGTKTLIEA